MIVRHRFLRRRMWLSILDTICWTRLLRTYLWGLYRKTEVVCKGLGTAICSTLSANMGETLEGV